MFYFVENIRNINMIFYDFLNFYPVTVFKYNENK